MAKYNNDNIGVATFLADVDLSNACALYKFAKNASTYGNVTYANGGSNAGVLGVLMDTASAGQAIRVKTVGHALVVGKNAGCYLTYGNYVVCASDGCAQSASAVAEADGLAVGRWLGATITSGSAVGEVLLFGAAACILARS